MKSSEQIALAIIAFSLATLLSFGIARAGETTLVERIELLVPSLASKKEPSVDPRELAESVAAATSSPQWAALLLTVMSHESALSSRIARSEYRDGEGDHGHAWGLPQIHKTQRNADYWGSPDIAVQVKEASHIARQYYNMCRGSGVPFPLSTLRAYAGRGCKMPLKGEDARMRTYERVLRKIQ